MRRAGQRQEKSVKSVTSESAVFEACESSLSLRSSKNFANCAPARERVSSEVMWAMRILTS